MKNAQISRRWLWRRDRPVHDESCWGKVDSYLRLRRRKGERVGGGQQDGSRHTCPAAKCKSKLNHADRQGRRTLLVPVQVDLQAAGEAGPSRTWALAIDPGVKRAVCEHLLTVSTHQDKSNSAA